MKGFRRTPEEQSFESVRDGLVEEIHCLRYRWSLPVFVAMIEKADQDQIALPGV